MRSTIYPVAVFAYNRPLHLKKTLTSLLQCEGVDSRPITIYCDGPRTKDDEELVEETRNIAKMMLGGSSNLRFSPSNLGLSQSIISGVTELCDRYGSAIVVEDDLLLAPSFLTYMVEGIEKCSRYEKVWQVSGHMYDVPELRERAGAVFLPLTTTWGWATWASAWRKFDGAARGWQELRRDAALRRAFNLGGRYDYASLLERQMSGAGDSWGVRWYWSTFRSSGLTLFPPQSLVKNMGQDGSGTHGSGKGIRKFAGNLTANWPRHVMIEAGDPIVDPDIWRSVKRGIWRQNGGWTGYFIDAARRTLRGLKNGAIARR